MEAFKRMDSLIGCNIEINIDLSIYSLISVQKACYKFTSECAVKLEKINEVNLRVIFIFQSNILDNSKEQMINDFHNEVLDQNLREIIASETESVRNLILAQAFSKTCLIEPE